MTVDRADHSAAPVPQPVATDASAKRCGTEQFVACESGAACSRKRGELVDAKPCFSRAADACDALGCEFGCLLSQGSPKEVHCAPNASTTSNGFERCGGLANWACAEHMRCALSPERLDAMGTCVPDA